MDEQPTNVEKELSNEEVYALFNEWYRRPTWVNYPGGEFQVVNRDKLMAVSRAFRRVASEKRSDF